MDVDVVRKKNIVTGWNITAFAQTRNGAKIARAQIYVNGYSKYDKSFSPPLGQWRQELIQQGKYPGSNTVRVDITDDCGRVISCDNSWSRVESQAPYMAE